MKALCLTQPDQGTDFLTALWLTKEHESRQICKLIHTETERTKRRLNFSSIEAETWSEREKLTKSWSPVWFNEDQLRLYQWKLILEENYSQETVTENYSSETAEQSDHHWVFTTRTVCSQRNNFINMKAPSNSVECCKWLNYIYLDAHNSEVCPCPVN